MNLRLNRLAEMVDPDSRLADIGTDLEHLQVARQGCLRDVETFLLKHFKKGILIVDPVVLYNLFYYGKPVVPFSHRVLPKMANA